MSIFIVTKPGELYCREGMCGEGERGKAGGQKMYNEYYYKDFLIEIFLRHIKAHLWCDLPTLQQGLSLLSKGTGLKRVGML